MSKRDTFNDRLSNLEYGYMETKDKPTEIAQTTLTNSTNNLKQSGKMLLIRNSTHHSQPLSFTDVATGPDIATGNWQSSASGEQEWNNFLLLMEIVEILFAHAITTDLVQYLARLIEGHHLEFSTLYPDESVLPKLHFMVHMPRLMQR